MLTFGRLPTEAARLRAVQQIYRSLRSGTTLEIQVDVESLVPLQQALDRAGLPPVLLVPRRDRPPAPLPAPFRRPHRVVLLGHGTVGGGVYEALRAWPDRFAVVGVGVRHPERHPGVPRELLETDVLGLVERQADIVVELLGGLDPATALIDAALRLGRQVVTANKAVIARRPDLAQRVHHSASVGGAIPVLETVRRYGRSLTRIEGVLNGTCNFVLGRIADGASFDEAVRAAQAAGFAEADPSTDLHGWDAAHKAVVVAREAFGIDLAAEDVAREELTEARPGRWRQVVEITRGGASVRLREVDRGPFSALVDADNCVCLFHPQGVEVLRGKGAGRWPTTTSVLSDLLDVDDEMALGSSEVRHAT
jgi:homoserine dehydrogenase